VHENNEVFSDSESQKSIQQRCGNGLMPIAGYLPKNRRTEDARLVA